MSTTTMGATFITVPDVAERWHASQRHVRDEIGRKRLRATKIGGQWLIKPADVEAYEQAAMNVRQSAKRTSPPRRRSA